MNFHTVIQPINWCTLNRYVQMTICPYTFLIESTIRRSWVGIDIWNNPIVGEELACEHENTGYAWGTTTSKSRAIFFYMEHKILEGKILANWSVIFHIHQVLHRQHSTLYSTQTIEGRKRMKHDSINANSASLKFYCDHYTKFLHTVGLDGHTVNKLNTASLQTAKNLLTLTWAT